MCYACRGLVRVMAETTLAIRYIISNTWMHTSMWSYLLSFLLLFFLSVFLSLLFFFAFLHFYAQSLECRACRGLVRVNAEASWSASRERRLSETTLATGHDMHASMWLMWFSLFSCFRLLSFFLHYPFIVPFCDLSCVIFIYFVLFIV